MNYPQVWTIKESSVLAECPGWMEEDFVVHFAPADGVAHVSDYWGRWHEIGEEVLEMAEPVKTVDGTLLRHREDGLERAMILVSRLGGGYLRKPGEWAWMWCGKVPLADYEEIGLI